MAGTKHTAKLLMQKLWLEQVSWDDKISEDLENEWLHMRSDFEHINDISIDRWIHTTAENKEHIQLHGFSDASSRAYAAVVYVKVTCLNNRYSYQSDRSQNKSSSIKNYFHSST